MKVRDHATPGSVRLPDPPPGDRMVRLHREKATGLFFCSNDTHWCKQVELGEDVDWTDWEEFEPETILDQNKGRY